jgi:hypothetical protein
MKTHYKNQAVKAANMFTGKYGVFAGIIYAILYLAEVIKEKK